MKRLHLFLALLCSLTGFSQAKMEIADAKKSFGFVKKGELVKVEYDISNKGNQPLLITDVEISCSCTTVDYPKQPIAPGQSVKVTVNFDTKTVYDRQDRTVNLISNDPKSPHKLRYKGVVLTK
jgi:hypothetical protein